MKSKGCGEHGYFVLSGRWRWDSPYLLLCSQLASTNIKEFAIDVDTLLADKLDAAFSVFKTDKLSLEHVTFIKNLLKLEDVKKGTEVSLLDFEKGTKI